MIRFFRHKDIADPAGSVPVTDAWCSALRGKGRGIAMLERHRDKIWAIKQGMMQQFLPGRVRLV